jgi:hypothetical protein
MVDPPEHLNISVSVGTASFSGEGPADRVMAALEKFTDLIATADLDSAPEFPADEEGAPPAAVKPAKTGEKEPLPVFLKSKTLSGNIEVATAIVAWAQKHDGKSDGIKTGEIATYWRGTKLKEPGNLTRDLGNAIKAGMLHRESGRYTVTGFGKTSIGLDD